MLGDKLINCSLHH